MNETVNKWQVRAYGGFNSDFIQLLARGRSRTGDILCVDLDFVSQVHRSTGLWLTRLLAPVESIGDDESIAWNVAADTIEEYESNQ